MSISGENSQQAGVKTKTTSREFQKRMSEPVSGKNGYDTLKRWRRFFNQGSPKEIVTSRYLFEHLFSAHLHFDSIPGDFYRLVRSKTPAPHKVILINSRRPYDPPGVEEFFYRFIRRVNKK